MDAPLINYIIIVIFLVTSPGPNTVLISNTAFGFGKKASFYCILGLLAATFIHGFLSLYGVSSLIVNSKLAFFYLKITGALYLIYLGYNLISPIFKSFYMKEIHQKKQSVKPLENKAILKRSSWSFFKEGFLTQILNPKVSLFYIAAYP